MANETLSPNMSLPVPGVGQTDGPQYATDVNSSLNIIDAHDHSAGQGVPVTPSGLDINTDLSIGGNNLTLARSLRFSEQSAPLAGATDLACIYAAGVDLYYNDGNGNQIRITQSGGIVGTPGSISGLVSPATATYVPSSSTFVWESNAATAANMDFASAILRNSTASSFGLTLTPPTLSSNYTITLPTIPVSQKIMSMDSSGHMLTTYTVDNSTIEISSNVIQVKDGGITKPKLAALGQVVGTANTQTTGSGSFTSMGLSITITTSGRPVFIGMLGSSSTSPTPCMFVQRNGSSTGIEGDFAIIRDAVSTVCIQTLSNEFASGSGLYRVKIPTGALWAIDPVSAGTYSYNVYARLISGDVVGVIEAKLIAYELG